MIVLPPEETNIETILGEPPKGGGKKERPPFNVRDLVLRQEGACVRSLRNLLFIFFARLKARNLWSVQKKVER